MEKRAETETMTTHLTQEWMKDVWKIQTAPKLKLFIWKIKHRALPVGDRLEARQIITEA